LKEWNADRAGIAFIYDEMLRDWRQTGEENRGLRSSLYVIRAERADQLRAHLAAQGSAARCIIQFLSINIRVRAERLAAHAEKAVTEILSLPFVALYEESARDGWRSRFENSTDLTDFGLYWKFKSLAGRVGGEFSGSNGLPPFTKKIAPSVDWPGSSLLATNAMADAAAAALSFRAHSRCAIACVSSYPLVECSECCVQRRFRRR